MAVDNKNRFDPSFKEIELPIFGMGSKSRFIRFDTQKTVNLYQARDDYGARKSAFFPMSGRLEQLTIPGSSPMRPGGSLSTPQYAYVIYGSTVYRIDASLNVVNIGSVSTATGQVGMLYYYDTGANSPVVLIVDGSLGWRYVVNTGSFAQITSDGFPANANAITSLDGYALVSQGGTQSIAVSAFNDSLSWGGKIAMQTAGEQVQQLAVLNKRILVFGRRVTEIFYNAGITTSIFAADYNLKMEYGLAAVGSVSVGYGFCMFLGSPANGPSKIMFTDGTRPVVYSTENINRQIANYTSPQDAVGNFYEQGGITFYEISWTAQNQTWVYNLTAQNWTERAEEGNRSALQSYFFFNNTSYIGTYNDTIVYDMAEQYADNNGAPIRRTRISQIFYDPFYHPINIGRVIIECLPGDVNNPRLSTLIGNVQAPDNLPCVYFSVSRDGGYTFEPARKLPIGLVGEYRNRAIADNLGRARQWVFKIEIFALSVQAILGVSALINVEST